MTFKIQVVATEQPKVGPARDLGTRVVEFVTLDEAERAIGSFEKITAERIPHDIGVMIYEVTRLY